MRVIVGSSLSPRLLVAHLDVSDHQEWTVVLSGELVSPPLQLPRSFNYFNCLKIVQELPPTHMCRGIYLAERSPFADVVSIEKRKRTSFFHAAANDDSQPVYLSKFKVPRRVRSKSSPKPVDIHQELPTNSADKTPRSSNDLMELILAKMTTMQTQLNARFDAVDQKLQQLTTRVEQMERSTKM